MKTLTFNVPTSFKEVLQWIKERKSRRRRHNVAVMRSLVREISKEVDREYWSNDISQTMKTRVFDIGCINSKLFEIYIKHKAKLK